MRWKTLPAVILLVLSGWVQTGLSLLGADERAFEPDHLIVVFKPGVQEDEKDAVEFSQGDAKIRPLHGVNGRLVKISRQRALAQAIRDYETDANVLYAQPNYIYYAVETIPNDTYFGLEWGLKNTGQLIRTGSGTAGADIEATFAWDITKGSAGVVVGVVDTGVDYTHPDLAANIWSNPGGIGGGAAGTHGYNAITGTYDPMDDNGHGTHVSGTIGAQGNNGVGVAGINWTTSIMGLKFLNAAGSGTTADAVSAIDFAVHAKQSGVNVRVLNASWGGGPFDTALRNEIALANANDILFVAAAGNSSLNNDSSPFYPANYSVDPNTPNVIAVAATDDRDSLASFSDYGAATVQLGAPGVDIASTWPGNQYVWASGTSMAAPHVTGSAALVLSAGSPLTTAQLKAAILNNVDPIPSLAGKTVTGGRLNVNKAMPAVGPPPPAPQTPTGLAATPGGGQVSLSWNSSSGATSYNVKRAGTSAGPYTTIASVTTTSYVDRNVTAGTTYFYVVSAVNAGGESSDSGWVSATPTAPPDFTISASPGSRTVARGNSTTYTVAISAVNGFSSSVSLNVSGLPSRSSGSFSPNPIPSGSTSSTLTVTTSRRTPTGTRMLTITGTSGNLSHSINVSLTVN